MGGGVRLLSAAETLTVVDEQKTSPSRPVTSPPCCLAAHELNGKPAQLATDRKTMAKRQVARVSCQSWGSRQDGLLGGTTIFDPCTPGLYSRGSLYFCEVHLFQQTRRCGDAVPLAGAGCRIFGWQRLGGRVLRCIGHVVLTLRADTSIVHERELGIRVIHRSRSMNTM